jgi:hypothetical protein
LPVGEFVYRAIKYENWLRKQTGEAKVPAFRRRWKYDKDGKELEIWDDDGLSFGITSEDACRELNEHFGAAKLSVELLRARNFQFDEPKDGYVHITNAPFYRHDDAEELKRSEASSMLMLEAIVAMIPKEKVGITSISPPD